MENRGLVLIVDDRPRNLKRLSEILQASGYQVRSAINSEMALLSALTIKPDMIILDTKTSGIEGLEFCRRLKENNSTANIAVKFINVSDEKSDKSEDIQSGTVEFITKSFDAEDVLARVQTHIEFCRNSDHLDSKDNDLNPKDEEILKQIEELKSQNEKIQFQYASLKESEEKYRFIFEHNDASIFIHDIYGKILSANNTACEEYGYTNDEFLSLRISDLVTPEQNIYANELTNQIINNEYYSFESVDKRKDGSLLNVHINARLIMFKNQNAIMSICRNVTNQKKAEAEKLEIQKQKLHAQKLESIGVLASGIAHDFNNLLSIILGNLDYLNYIEIENPIILDKIANAKFAVKKAAILTEQLLAYSGKATYLIRKLDLNTMIVANLNNFKKIIGHKINLETYLRYKLPLINGDEYKLQQVLLNLLTNAYEAIGDNNGDIRIYTGTSYYDEKNLEKSILRQKSTPGNFVFVRITDNGCGMDEELISKIFEPFFSSKFTGRGLGMSAVHGVLTAHLGGIFIESNPCDGSSVTIILPVADTDIQSQNIIIKPESVKLESLIQESLKFKGTLIVADDEAMVLAINTEMLEMVGFDILRANDGIEALKIFKENSAIVDGLLLDLTMSSLGGVPTAKAIREMDKDVRILFSSGYSETDESLCLDSVTHSGFLHKPLQMNELIETMAIVFDDLIVLRH